LDGETWDGLQRVRLKTRIPMRTPEGEFTSELTYTFTLFDELPYLYVDVEARYAYTPKRQVIHNLTQKLRRLMDLRWVETAPFQLTPALTSDNLRVWKHNYMGITSYYDLDYGTINSKNRELDSFNHQVTAGWVAVSDGKHGLLVGEDAGSLSSMAFCPMRLREKDDRQVISLNPFGSYYGKQFDYSHLGGNGNGTLIMLPEWTVLQWRDVALLIDACALSWRRAAKGNPERCRVAFLRARCDRPFGAAGNKYGDGQ
jgi:hypothetical protein